MAAATEEVAVQAVATAKGQALGAVATATEEVAVQEAVATAVAVTVKEVAVKEVAVQEVAVQEVGAMGVTGDEAVAAAKGQALGAVAAATEEVQTSRREGTAETAEKAVVTEDPPPLWVVVAAMAVVAARLHKSACVGRSRCSRRRMCIS